MKSLRRDFLPPDLEKWIVEYGMDGTVAVQARQCEEETEFLLNLAEQYPNVIKGVVGWVDLRAANVDERVSNHKFYSRYSQLILQRIRNQLVFVILYMFLVSIVISQVQDEPDDEFLLGEDFVNGIRCLKKYNLTYDILIYPKHLKVAKRFVEMFPDQPFVIDHIAKPFIKDHVIGDWEEGIRVNYLY